MKRLFVLLVAALLLHGQAALAENRLIVFAPASMTEVIQRIADDFEHPEVDGVSVSVAGTGQLARQIEAGAPADIFISADPRWVKWLKERNLIVRGGDFTIAVNRLVIAVRRETENWADPLQMLTQGRFAMGEPDSVPAGSYARDGMIKLGIWEKARPNAVFGENVRLALKQLERGEVEAAIVYASDLVHAPDLREIYTFGENGGDAVEYTAALVNQQILNPFAIDFIVHLTSDESREKMRKAGFVPTGPQVR